MSEKSSLILTRKVGEEIVIGEDITITVIDQRQGRTRFKVEAPRETRVRRGETPPEARKQAPATPLALFMPNRGGGRHGLPIDVSWSA